MFWLFQKAKNVTTNAEHRITVKTSFGDVEFTNLEDVFVTTIFDAVYVIGEDKYDGIKPIYGTRTTKKAENKAKKMRHTLLKAYNKGHSVVTLS